MAIGGGGGVVPASLSSPTESSPIVSTWQELSGNIQSLHGFPSYVDLPAVPVSPPSLVRRIDSNFEGALNLGRQGPLGPLQKHLEDVLKSWRSYLLVDRSCEGTMHPVLLVKDITCMVGENCCNALGPGKLRFLNLSR